MKKRILPFLAAAAALCALGQHANAGASDHAGAKSSGRTRAEVLADYVIARSSGAGTARTGTNLSTRTRGAVLADYDVARPVGGGITKGVIAHGGLTPARIASDDVRVEPSQPSLRVRSHASEPSGG